MKAVAALMLMTTIVCAIGCKKLNGGSGSYNGHDYVDLGLPSGLLWATCNVGADTPEGYGDYFAWGETQPKDVYKQSTYQYYYNFDGIGGFHVNKYNAGDCLDTLLPEDDAATVNWGAGWRMPTKTEWQELYDNTTVTWTQQNSVYGRLFTASNGNSLFLPAAGYYSYGSNLKQAGRIGDYWSSSRTEGNNTGAIVFGFNSVIYGTDLDERPDGHSVRGVLSSRQN